MASEVDVQVLACGERWPPQAKVSSTYSAADLSKLRSDIASNDCLSDSALVHLKSYKYSSVDKSLITHYLLRHYVRLVEAYSCLADHDQWNGAAELLPLWLAPNMVTLIGFMFIIANVAILMIEVPDLIGPVWLTSTPRGLC